MTSRFKKLGLGSVILGGAFGLSSLSGCNLIGAFLIADHHAHVVANGQRDAARIRAGGDSNQEMPFFACDPYYDFNGNGLAESDEIRGRRDKFKSSESIAFIGYIQDRQGQWVSLKMFNGNMEQLNERHTFIGGPNWVTTERDFVYLPESFSPGGYTAVWVASDGTLLGSKRFEVYN